MEGKGRLVRVTAPCPVSSGDKAALRDGGLFRRKERASETYFVIHIAADVGGVCVVNMPVLKSRVLLDFRKGNHRDWLGKLPPVRVPVHDSYAEACQ